MPTITEDALFAGLAARVAQDKGERDGAAAAADLRRVLLPACERIAAMRGPKFLDAVVDAACREVLDWAACKS
jgi:hypothetical protein